MTMPDPGVSLHIATLDYYCTFGEVSAAAGPVTFSVPDPVRFTFTFETAATETSPGVVQVTWDYSWFTQASTEAAIAGALDQICAAVAALLSLPAAQVQAVVTVRRVWTIRPNLQGAGVSSGSTALTEVMIYPAV